AVATYSATGRSPIWRRVRSNSANAMRSCPGSSSDTELASRGPGPNPFRSSASVRPPTLGKAGAGPTGPLGGGPAAPFPPFAPPQEASATPPRIATRTNRPAAHAPTRRAYASDLAPAAVHREPPLG